MAVFFMKNHIKSRAKGWYHRIHTFPVPDPSIGSVVGKGRAHLQAHVCKTFHHQRTGPDPPGSSDLPLDRESTDPTKVFQDPRVLSA